jgi:hypothetical protein
MYLSRIKGHSVARNATGAISKRAQVALLARGLLEITLKRDPGAEQESASESRSTIRAVRKTAGAKVNYSLSGQAR